MRRGVLLLGFVCLLVGGLRADLVCENMNITLESQDSNLSNCTQWASGLVTRNDTAEGPLCLFTCSVHSYNVCEPTIIVWLGVYWNYTCWEMASDESYVHWTFTSNREDWEDLDGSTAEIYIGVPCNFNCQIKHIYVGWTELSSTCEGCDD